MATVYAVASAKGGVGKTTTTAAVATLLADSGADVVAIDADLGMANLAGAVGVTPGGITLHDVLAGAADPLDAVHEGPVGLRIVPGAADLKAYAAADPSRLREVVDAFDDADYVFVDAGAGLSHDSTLPLGLADETLLVSTAERSALGDTEKTRQLTERLGGSVAGAAITRLDPATAADDDPIDAVAETLDAPVIGRIPEDDAVLRAVESGQPLPVFAPDAPATRAYRDLTRALTGAAIDGPGLVDGADAETENEDTIAGGAHSRDTIAGGAHSRADTARAGKAESLDEADSGDVTETSREDDSIPDAEASDESEKADESEEIGESEEVPDEADAQDDEDIIVADSEQAGLGEPGDEEDIIVAAESPVEDIEEAEATDAESDPEATDAESDPEATTVDAVDGETETVGDEHVDGDDLEAMIEEDPEPETFDDEGDSTAEPTEGGDPADPESSVESPPDEEPESDGESVPVSESESEPAPESESGPNEETEPDPDDELAGSIPFRDDDTGTMNTAFSEDDDDNDENGGFFSRLLGR
jgi:septum site-determining protein MinD